MVSPVAWTLREVCTVQPLCRSIRFIGADDCATASASRNENRESTRLIRVIRTLLMSFQALKRIIRRLYVRHDERADRVVINAAPETHMAVLVLTRLHLFTLEQIAGGDVEPARNRLYQLIASDREAIHVAAAG